MYEHTHEVLSALADAGITADYVQVGNEINPGMMAPYGQTWSFADDSGAHWDDLAAFLTAGYDAVKDVDASTQTILHLTNINNGIGSLTWWFDEVTARDVPFDVVGLSYYGYWHGSLGDLQDAVTTLSDRYDRDVVVVETAYPFTLEDDTDSSWENVIDRESELVQGYPATIAGQAAALRAVQDTVASAPGGRGIGSVYWEPAWTDAAGNGWDPEDPTSGNAWENQALFDFDGQLLAGASELAPDAADSAWSRAAVYDTGDVVLHDGAAYRAGWWTSGDVPGASPWSAWQSVAESDDEGSAAWSTTTVYDTGDVVSFDGAYWTARWWTRNQQPGSTPYGPWVRTP
ncbi:hypothetical protein GCM10025865_07280 [Paraoerskovia sediminicola]|uniref:Arabinogalactan endo-beta-1,4-galactanase n=1 Tax=Paraoerskovia sediminicola TaxID=1138587 RepID=A0ABM8G081_9CELL|nr:hypothetical protein GCM10025865_07280 [Paraoerskovia sediminicola]